MPGPELDRPNNVSLITRSKSNIGYAAAFLSKSHDDEVKRSRFKFKSGSTKKTRPRLVSEHYPRKKSWVAADAVKEIFPSKRLIHYTRKCSKTAEGTDKEQEYRKLIQALHAMAASDKYFGKPQPPIGGYHWFMRVVERSDWKVEEHHMPLLEELHGEIVYDYRRSMGLASIFYQILSEDSAGHFDLNPRILRSSARECSSFVDALKRSNHILNTLHSGLPSKSERCEVFKSIVGKTFSNYDAVNTGITSALGQARWS